MKLHTPILSPFGWMMLACVGFWAAIARATGVL